MFLNCLSFILKVKKGVPLYQSSPILYDISNVETWDKVAKGLVKMYQKEVLGKLPVV